MIDEQRLDLFVKTMAKSERAILNAVGAKKQEQLKGVLHKFEKYGILVENQDNPAVKTYDTSKVTKMLESLKGDVRTYPNTIFESESGKECITIEALDSIIDQKVKALFETK
jgi:hypothetical protein